MTGAELVESLHLTLRSLRQEEARKALWTLREPAGDAIDEAIAGFSGEGVDPAALSTAAAEAVAGVLDDAEAPGGAVIRLFAPLLEKLVLKLSAVTLEADEFEGIADLRGT